MNDLIEKNGIAQNDTTIVTGIVLDKHGKVTQRYISPILKGEPMAEYKYAFQEGRKTVFWHQGKKYRRIQILKAIVLCNMPDWKRQKELGIFQGRERKYF